MRNPGIGFVRIQDGSMAETNREEKSCGTQERARGRGAGGGQGEIYPCGNIARVHTWPRAVQQLRLQTLRRRQGMKRGGKTSAERRVVVGHHGCRARAREREKEKERQKGGEREREREREERCAGVWMLRFQLRIRPAKISTPLDAGNRIGTGYATISTDTINDAFCTGRSA